MQGIRVLIVDDSELFRRMVSDQIMKSLPPGSEIKVAGDPFEARDRIMDFDPDVMLLDVEMPRMDGLEFLRKLRAQYPLPTVVYSSREEYRIKALAYGAVDFVLKPTAQTGPAAESYYMVLAKKLMASALTPVGVLNAQNNTPPKPVPVVSQPALSQPDENLAQSLNPVLMAAAAKVGKGTSFCPGMDRSIIAIGASTGGTEALASVMMNLQPPLPGIVVVQHIPPMFSRLFAERLNNDTPLQVKEAENGDVVEPGHAYIAPGLQQVRVKKLGRDYILDVAPGPRVNGHCPSVDVMFGSVAQCAGNTALGVILTGMGNDGARGLLQMRQAGAKTLGQDEASCVVYGMPRAAWEMGGVERQLPLDAMAMAITAIARGSRND